MVIWWDIFIYWITNLSIKEFHSKSFDSMNRSVLESYYFSIYFSNLCFFLSTSVSRSTSLCSNNAKIKIRRGYLSSIKNSLKLSNIFICNFPSFNTNMLFRIRQKRQTIDIYLKFSMKVKKPQNLLKLSWSNEQCISLSFLLFE